MRILDRYIGQVVQVSVLASLAVILIIFALSSFVNEFTNIGRADFTTWVAIKYIFLWMPKTIYQVFPMAALLGTMLGLGLLASHSELVVLRAAGVSKFRIAGSVVKSMLALTVVIFIIGEVIAPEAEHYAEEMKLKALRLGVSLNTEYGLWVRDKNTFINVGSLDRNGDLKNITMTILDKDKGITRIIKARSASYDGSQWQLKNVLSSEIGNEGLKHTRLKTLPWTSLIDADMLETVTFNPDSLSLWKQWEYIDYLRSNNLDSRIYELSFWNKVIMPLTVIAMVLLAVPFIFGSQRQTSLGRQIVLGFLIGIIFYITSRLMGQVGLVYNIPPVVSASIPTLLIFTLTGWLFRRAH